MIAGRPYLVDGLPSERVQGTTPGPDAMARPNAAPAVRHPS
jgi:hypothetical protein